MDPFLRVREKRPGRDNLKTEKAPGEGGEPVLGESLQW